MCASSGEHSGGHRRSGGAEGEGVTLTEGEREETIKKFDIFFQIGAGDGMAGMEQV